LNRIFVDMLFLFVHRFIINLVNGLRSFLCKVLGWRTVFLLVGRRWCIHCRLCVIRRHHHSVILWAESGIHLGYWHQSRFAGVLQ